MLNPRVFRRDTSIYAIIFIPCNTFKEDNSKKLFHLEIFLSPNVENRNFIKRYGNEINA
jgi:hypothetical protein